MVLLKKVMVEEEMEGLRVIDETTWIQFRCNLDAS